MKKILIYIVLSFYFVPVIAFCDQFAWYGYIKNGAGSYDTRDLRVYEYGKGNDTGEKWNYCIHAATAAALNIRLGRSSVTLDGMHQGFSKYQSYNANPARLGSLSWVRQLSFSDGLVPDMKAVLNDSIYYGDGTALFQKIKDAAQYNNPIVVAVTSYSPKSPTADADKVYSVVRGFWKSNVGHGLLITGYIELDKNNYDNNLVMIRDPFISQPMVSIYTNLFDYTIPVGTLNGLIQNSG